MPAVKSFAIFATLAITFNLLLQLTAFIALLAIDERRYQVPDYYDLYLRSTFYYCTKKKYH